MTRDISAMTPEAKEFMKLRDIIFKVIPQAVDKNFGTPEQKKAKITSRKKWRRFVEYMNSYYKDYPSAAK